MRHRIELLDGTEVAVSGWATFSQADGVQTATLDHEYPDRKPATGWFLVSGIGTYHVVGVEGKRLTLQKAEG